MTTVADVYAALARTGRVTVEMLEVIPPEHVQQLMADAARIRWWIANGDEDRVYACRAADQQCARMQGLIGADEPAALMMPPHIEGGPW